MSDHPSPRHPPNLAIPLLLAHTELSRYKYPSTRRGWESWRTGCDRATLVSSASTSFALITATCAASELGDARGTLRFFQSVVGLFSNDEIASSVGSFPLAYFSIIN
jgi:hypothetical protein